MKYRIGIKFLFTGISLLILTFCTNFSVQASDYQYKVLDPKYNPQAEKLLEGKMPEVKVVDYEQQKPFFDFKIFFAVLALVLFPSGIMYLVVKTFKEISEDVPGRSSQEQIIGNIKIEKREEKEPVEKTLKAEQKQVNVKQESASAKSVSPKIEQNPQKPAAVNNATPVIQQNKSRNIGAVQPAVSKQSPRNKITDNTNFSINKYFSSTVTKKQNPMLLNTSVLGTDKGLCLVEYNQKYSLIGYIGNEIFMLNQFDSINSSEIRSRLSDSNELRDRYIVRLGDYKALVEVSDKKMNLLLEL